MLTWFRRKRVPPSDGVPTQLPRKGLLLPEPAATLLASPRREQLINHIWQRTSLSRAQFASLYRAPLERYAALVQQFPASEAHHHSYPGGMLDHGLEIVAYALRLRQSHLLPVGAPPESQAALAEAWTAGTAYAALLHDVGKVAVDLHVEHEDGSRWYPWYGPLQRPYRFRFRQDREYRLHGAAAGLLYTDILDPPIMDWLSDFPDLWAALLYVLAGQYEHAGILGELVTQADQASVAQDLGGDFAKARVAPKRTLQRQLIDGLRYLVRELKLNQSHASDGWLTQDALWLVSKTTCDRLRAHLLSHGIDGIPEQNISMFNMLQDHGIVLAAPNGKAIWRATVVSDSGWSNSFTFLRLSPALIWDADERPAPFAGLVRIEESGSVEHAQASAKRVGLASSPSAGAISASETTKSPSAESGDSISDLLTLLDNGPSATRDTQTEQADTESHSKGSVHDDRDVQQPRLNQELPNVRSGSDEEVGTRFVSWLRNSIASRHLVINDAKALVHTVAGTAFVVSPATFHRFIQEHPEVARLAKQKNITLDDSAWVQKQFEKLRLHKKQNNGLNIWMCEVAGLRKTRRLHGYLLTDGRELFSDVPCDNPHLKLLSPTPKRSVA